MIEEIAKEVNIKEIQKKITNEFHFEEEEEILVEIVKIMACKDLTTAQELANIIPNPTHDI